MRERQRRRQRPSDQARLQTEATQPPQIAAASKLLVSTDHVLGMAGTSSILECTIDHSYWEKLGYKVIAAGIAPECYSTPNYADVNMGPRYSSDGAVQYGISQKPSKIVFVAVERPGHRVYRRWAERARESGECTDRPT